MDSLSTSGGTEDHVSMGGFAARKVLKIVENVERGRVLQLYFKSSTLCSYKTWNLPPPLCLISLSHRTSSCLSRNWISPSPDHNAAFGGSPFFGSDTCQVSIFWVQIVNVCHVIKNRAWLSHCYLRMEIKVVKSKAYWRRHTTTNQLDHRLDLGVDFTEAGKPEGREKDPRSTGEIPSKYRRDPSNYRKDPLKYRRDGLKVQERSLEVQERSLKVQERRTMSFKLRINTGPIYNTQLLLLYII